MSNRLGGALWKNRINYKVRYLFWGSARFPKFDLLTAIVLVLEWPSNYGLLWWLVCYIKREGIYINLFCFMVLRKTNFYIWPSNCHQIFFCGGECEKHDKESKEFEFYLSIQCLQQVQGEYKKVFEAADLTLRFSMQNWQLHKNSTTTTIAQ